MESRTRNRMVRWTTTAVLACVAGMVGHQAVGGESLSVEASADVVSKYVWRGMLLTDDPVLQPSVTVSGYGFSANVWGSIDLTDVNEDNDESMRMQELDFTLSYGFSPAEGLDLEGGVIWYTFPSADSTGEVYGSATLSSVPLSPCLAVYYDFDEVDGFYANLGIGHTFDLTEKLGLSLGASVGWGDGEYHEAYFGEMASASMSDVLLSASLDYALSETVSVSVYAGYSDLLDSDLEDLAEPDDSYGDSSVFFGGISLGVAF